MPMPVSRTRKSSQPFSVAALTSIDPFGRLYWIALCNKVTRISRSLSGSVVHATSSGQSTRVEPLAGERGMELRGDGAGAGQWTTELGRSVHLLGSWWH